MNSLPTGYYAEIAEQRRGWRRFFRTAPGAKRCAGNPLPPSAQAVAQISAAIPATLKKNNPFSGLRIRLVGTVFLAIVPPMALMYFFHLENWAGFLVGLLALAAAWYGGEHFIMRQLRVLLSATTRLADGDLTSRTGVTDTKSELGQLARIFDMMAESLQERSREREESEKLLLNRAQQQAVVAALGQFAMVSQDFNALLNQALQLVSQTLEVPIAHALELQPDGESLIFRAGLGWTAGRVGNNIF